MSVECIALGCDHAATDMLAAISNHLEWRGYNILVFTPPEGKSVDYPEYAEMVALAVQGKRADLGILVCGTGAGMCIAANKVRGIRAVVCSEAFTAKLSKEHNDSNILCIGARVVNNETAAEIIDSWLNAEFEAGGRHERRVGLIKGIEEKQGK
ncbi:MAG: ribose 5-phosphate isomerase B [Defluviitaleaceae bacterium]|nr:ribose 5-phosphate isomerase B [Defluviitaleaceae bacterium]